MDSIPPNNPEHPRWLLDLPNWTLCDYRDIRQAVEDEGYGIISYTWGMYRDGPNVVDRNLLPRGVTWDVPRLRQMHDGRIANITFERTKVAVGRMNLNYVWWDWMCVPQGQATNSPLGVAAGEEIAKQMVIYKKATRSIVWLHDTGWYSNSHIKSLLLPSCQHPNIYQPDVLLRVISDCQNDEPWLTSIWTLQEGVILKETPLIDYNGNELVGTTFPIGRATVQDLTIFPTWAASNITDALLHINEMPARSPLIENLRRDPGLLLLAKKYVAHLVQSGLVAYTSGLALFILAGKHSRRANPDNLDNYWALVGALDLHDVEVSYTATIEEARVRFFGPLLQRHQWHLFMAPALPDTVRRHGWPGAISDGRLFPLGMYFGIDLENDLPRILWSENGLKVLPAQPGQEIPILTFDKYSCRRYIQHQHTGNTPLVDVVGPEESTPTAHTVYLHIAQLTSRFGMHGKRCIELVKWSETPILASGSFNGVVDIWHSMEDLTTSHVSQIEMYI